VCELVGLEPSLKKLGFKLSLKLNFKPNLISVFGLKPDLVFKLSFG